MILYRPEIFINNFLQRLTEEKWTLGPLRVCFYMMLKKEISNLNIAGLK